MCHVKMSTMFIRAGDFVSW